MWSDWFVVSQGKQNEVAAKKNILLNIAGVKNWIIWARLVNCMAADT